MLKKRIKKWLYGHCPGIAGSFPYFGTKVYFPKNSVIFQAACSDGIYEVENLHIVASCVKPGSVYFDVGANIGLMAVPVLRNCKECTVVSFEPSPSTLPYLMKTAAASDFKDRWQVIGKAAGDKSGELTFFVSPEGLGAYDSLANTARVSGTSEVIVPVTTIDAEWESMGRPAVSIIKIDVEGAEMSALRGACSCIGQERPILLVEWNASNFKAFGNSSEDLLTYAESNGYRLFCVPNMVPVCDVVTLKLQMLMRENFLLIPQENNSLD